MTAKFFVGVYFLSLTAAVAVWVLIDLLYGARNFFSRSEQ